MPACKCTNNIAGLLSQQPSDRRVQRVWLAPAMFLLTKVKPMQTLIHLPYISMTGQLSGVCRCPASILTGVGGSRCPASILTGVRGSRCPTRILTGVRGSRCPTRILTGVRGSRCPASILTGVRGSRCPASILTGVRGMQVPCKYPDRCQGYASALQISWSVSGVAGVLQVSWPVSGVAGAPQVSWPVSGVCKCPANILTGVRGSRCPANILIGVRSGAEIGLLSLSRSVSQGASLGDFLFAPACLIEKITLWEAFLYLTLESETAEGVAKDKVFAQTGNRTQSPVRYPLGYCISLLRNSVVP